MPCCQHQPDAGNYVDNQQCTITNFFCECDRDLIIQKSGKWIHKGPCFDMHKANLRYALMEANPQWLQLGPNEIAGPPVSASIIMSTSSGQFGSEEMATIFTANDTATGEPYSQEQIDSYLTSKLIGDDDVECFLDHMHPV